MTTGIIRGRIGVLCFSALLVMLTACGAGGAPVGQHPNDARPGTVQVEVRSFEIKPSTHTIHTGAITFEATNTDAITHEMLVVRVADLEPEGAAVKLASMKDSDVGALERAAGDQLATQLHGEAYDFVTSRLLEDEIDSLGEVADIAGGTSGSVTLDLPPGQYLLLCNITAHYQSGMYTTLTVTP